MENAIRKERRLGNRKALNGLLPGRLQTPSGVDLVCKPVDISPHGLGILVDRDLVPGNALHLIMKDRTIDLTVAWVQHDFHKEELFRLGLVTNDVDLDLERIFLDSGCLK